MKDLNPIHLREAEGYGLGIDSSMAEGWND